MRRFRVGPEDRGFQDIARIGHNGGPKLGDIGAFDSNPGADYVPADGVARLTAGYPDIGQVLKTRRGFASVPLIPTGYGNDVRGSQIAARNGNLYLVSASRNLLRSTDGGASFQEISTTVATTSVVAPPGSDIIMCLETGKQAHISPISVSANNGASFTNRNIVNSGAPSVVGIFFIGQPHNLICVGMPDGFLYTLAAPYTDLFTSRNTGSVTNYFAYRGDCNELTGTVGTIVGTGGSGTVSYVKVYNSAFTYQKLITLDTSNNGVRDIKCRNGIWVITTTTGLWVSRDDLATATRLRAGAHGAIEWFDGVWLIAKEASASDDFWVGDASLNTLTAMKMTPYSTGVAALNVLNVGGRGYAVPNLASSSVLLSSPGAPESEYFVSPFVSNDLKSGAYYMRAKP